MSAAPATVPKQGTHNGSYWWGYDYETKVTQGNETNTVIKGVRNVGNDSLLTVAADGSFSLRLGVFTVAGHFRDGLRISDTSIVYTDGGMAPRTTPQGGFYELSGRPFDCGWPFDGTVFQAFLRFDNMSREDGSGSIYFVAAFSGV